MKKTALSITPFGGYDIPGLEGWLSARPEGSFPLQILSLCGSSVFEKEG